MRDQVSGPDYPRVLPVRMAWVGSLGLLFSRSDLGRLMVKRGWEVSA